jgi:hypothetical protein
VVVVVAPSPVVVVVDAPGPLVVVVVEVPVDDVVLVVVGDVVLVVVEEVGVDVVVLVVVVVGLGGGEGPKMLFTDVPVPEWPKIDDSGLPAISSTAVMNSSASTNTTAAVPAMAFQVNRRGEV